MDKSESCMAMLLAGGNGSRLDALTKRTSKPAVHFGAKYRLIDFTLSNCVNSKIRTIGVLTQYQPEELHRHIGDGRPWGSDTGKTDIHILNSRAIHDEYLGTADAIIKNEAFIDQYRPLYLLVLSGDHVYKMDYQKMLDFHIEHQSEATIAVTNVTYEESGNFGIIETDGRGRISGFEEKPSKPRSTLASMGVYIFNWDILRKYLSVDQRNTQSSHDFGKNIIPDLLKADRLVYAYEYKGYWRDVGSVRSLWEASMDLLTEPSRIDIFDPDWPVYGREYFAPNYYSHDTAASKSLIAENCTICGDVRHSVVFPHVFVGENASVRDSVLMPGAIIRSGKKVNKSIVGPDTVIEEDITIGGNPITGQTQNLASVIEGITLVVNAGFRRHMWQQFNHIP